MRKANQKRKKEHRYEIAAILLVVASLGFATIYIQDRYENKAKQEAKLEEEKENTKIVSSVVEPQTKKNTEKSENVEKEQSSGANEGEENVEKSKETSTSSPTLHFNGQIDWPLEGDVIINYSMDHTVYFKTLQQYQYSPAIVISGNVNDKVAAVSKGVVTAITDDAKYGRMVTMDLGDGYTAIYGQLKEIPYAVGDIVLQKETVGYINEPTKYFSEEGSNLYFQLKKDGQSINPMDFFTE